MKFRKIIAYDKTEHIAYNCPGCKYEHAFSPNVHKWDGDYDAPTVSPSLLHSNPQGHHTCHSFIRQGKIEFLGDCWHDLKNQTVELPEYPDGTPRIFNVEYD